jgi:hypothetical protein
MMAYLADGARHVTFCMDTDTCKLYTEHSILLNRKKLNVKPKILKLRESVPEETVHRNR